MCITKVPLPFSVYYGNVLSFFGAIEDPTVESSVKYADKMGESAISGFIFVKESQEDMVDLQGSINVAEASDSRALVTFFNGNISWMLVRTHVQRGLVVGSWANPLRV